jgi:hypothetical protein
LRGLGGNFPLDWVAGFAWTGWQPSRGLSGRNPWNTQSVEPLAQGVRPRVDGVWLGCKDAACALLRARCLQADIVFGIGPVDADEGRKLLRRETRPVSPPVGDARVGRRDMPACVLRRHYREPVVRQTLSVRERTQAHPRIRGYVSKHHVLRLGYSSSAGACSCFP